MLVAGVDGCRDGWVVVIAEAQDDRLSLHSVVVAPSFKDVLATTLACAAVAVDMPICGKRISKQTFNITPKISEVDVALWPSDQSRVVEAHPELAFWRLDGGRPMAHNKKTSAGSAERVLLLSAVYNEDVSSWPVPRGAVRDDLYDAAVLVRTASRIAVGCEERLPEEPQLDARGLRMEIVY